ncbi:MAG TPA: PRC-barrel domain-containing protein [Candidatus Nanoarchaeia archaeon]|nr:PRC-barrel domain-containing protein [Candidatus Nanoarchaeia archaeon]
MIKTRKISELYDMDVYTDSGDFFGVVEESILTNNKIAGWRVKATKNSKLSTLLGGAKGVIVPHHMVRAIGNVMIISKNALPEHEEELEKSE